MVGTDVGSIDLTPEYFEPIEEGWSKFLIATVIDPAFAVGQIWTLREWAREPGEYTGRWLRVKITHVVKGSNHWAIDNTTSAFSFIRVNQGVSFQ